MTPRTAIGIDLGGTFIKAGLVREDGHVLGRWKEPTRASQGSQSVLDSLLSVTRSVFQSEALHDWKAAGGKGPTGIGIGSPGMVDSREGRVLRATANLPGWAGTQLGPIFQREFNLPVSLDNDANAFAWGEYHFGNGREFSSRTLLVLTLGTGVGGGVVHEGRLLHGAHGAAGELGHITVSESDDAPLCSCGAHGCLESFVSASAMVKFAVEQVKDFPASAVFELSAGEPVTARHIHDAARHGDPLALLVVQRVARFLGLGLAGLVCCFDPDTVAVGGGVSNLGDLLFPAVEESVRQRVFFSEVAPLRIVPARLGSDDGYLGAAALALFPQD